MKKNIYIFYCNVDMREEEQVFNKQQKIYNRIREKNSNQSDVKNPRHTHTHHVQSQSNWKQS